MSRTETETTDSDGDGDGNRPGQSVEISEDERWRLESKALAEVPSIDANGTPIKSPRAYARKKLANAAWVADQLAELRAETARERSQADLEPLDDLRERDTA
jgi:phage terminase Nu1 subunit (DNA packaging protein)